MLLLFAAGLMAGAMNALAGGGSFVSLPALIAGGLPSVQANASSTVALWPGGAASAWIYFTRPGPVCGVGLGPMLVVTLVGGLTGSLLLMWTPSALFDLALPWLLLLATLALAFGRSLGAALAGRLRRNRVVVLSVQFGLGIYGGYFGGAVGLMMLAAWSVLGGDEIKALNGPRTLLVSAANTVAMVAFIIAGVVRWPETLAMLAGGLLGGAGGARLGRVVPAAVTRRLTLVWTVLVTAVFFARAYLFPG
jgi:uncharacterized membrane protein YfcA